MWPFRKNATNVALLQRMEQLEAALELLTVQHKALRGRVYARMGRAGDLAEPPQTARELLPLTDPRLTKAEVRARLQAAGALKPHDPSKPN